MENWLLKLQPLMQIFFPPSLFWGFSHRQAPHTHNQIEHMHTLHLAPLDSVLFPSQRSSRNMSCIHTTLAKVCRTWFHTHSHTFYLYFLTINFSAEHIYTQLHLPYTVFPHHLTHTFDSLYLIQIWVFTWSYFLPEPEIWSVNLIPESKYLSFSNLNLKCDI